MHPEIHLNFPAVIAAVVASILFGMLWHGPLFGKQWMALMGMTSKPDPKVVKKMMMRGIGLMVLGGFLMAWVLTYTSDIWRPSVWGLGPDAPAYVYGFATAFFTWIGFYVPLLLNTVAWEGRSWSLFGINAGFHFFNLNLMALILAYWR
jgi:hypothetical protein